MSTNTNYQPEADSDNIVILTDEDGTESRYELLDMIQYSGTDYAVLVRAQHDDGGEEADAVEIFRVEDADKDTNTLIPVTSSETADAIFGLFKVKNKDRFDFV